MIWIRRGIQCFFWLNLIFSIGLGHVPCLGFVLLSERIMGILGKDGVRIFACYPLFCFLED